MVMVVVVVVLASGHLIFTRCGDNDLPGPLRIDRTIYDS